MSRQHLLPSSTLRYAPLAARYGHIVRWMWLALPEDCQQEAALYEIEYPCLTERAREEMLAYRLARLAREVWRREISPPVRVPHGLRPSKLRTRRGYRQDKGVGHGYA